MNIGIIGYGVVGKAVHEWLPGMHEVFIYDPKYDDDPTWCHGDNVEDNEAVFICVPTPTKNGKQDLSMLVSVLDNLTERGYIGDVIIRSTILPTFDVSKYPLRIMAAPEFLNQATPYKAQNMHIIGVQDIYQAETYRNIFGPCDDYKIVDFKTAWMIKYVHNVHGAIKVAMFHEFAANCEKMGVDYRTMLDGLFSVNNNVGKQYTTLAADGKKGFGGACFPKDIVAYENLFKNTLAYAAIVYNNKLRSEEMDSVL